MGPIGPIGVILTNGEPFDIHFEVENMAATMCIRIDKVHLTIRRFLYRTSRFSTAVPSPRKDDDEDLYPPIKPKFPEGRWGSMSRRHAWLWDAKRRMVSRLPTVKKRIDHLTKKDMKMWRFKVEENYPRCLTYQKYITKTHLVDGLPKLYDNVDVDEIVKKIKPLIIDTISLEQSVLNREKILLKPAPWLRNGYRSRIMLKHLINTLTACLSSKCCHLVSAQFDEDVRIEAFWDRYGIRRRRIPEYKDEDEKAYEYVTDSRLQSGYTADFLIRSEDPLPEFLPRDDELCSSGAYPELDYHPTTYGQIEQYKQKPRVVAGHWPGDPCEFGVVTLQIVDNLHRQANKYGETTLQELLTGTGMNMSFVRLLAEAHYQGFNTVEELTYPLTTQTILTDGQNFYLFAYQLNTLELWKDNDANPLRNICWHTGQLKLFELMEDGEVKGFNDDVLKQIVKFLVLQPGRPGLRLRPASLSKAAPGDTQQFINEKVEKIVLKKEETYV